MLPFYFYLQLHAPPPSNYLYMFINIVLFNYLIANLAV